MVCRLVLVLVGATFCLFSGGCGSTESEETQAGASLPPSAPASGTISNTTSDTDPAKPTAVEGSGNQAGPERVSSPVAQSQTSGAPANREERPSFLTQQGNAFEYYERARQLDSENNRAILLARQGKWSEAEAVLEKVASDVPYVPDARYNLACLKALQGKNQEALVELRRAVEAGFLEPEHILADADLAALRPEPEFQQAVQRARTLMEEPFEAQASKPSKIVDQLAKIGPEQTVFDGRFKLIRTDIAWGPRPQPTDEHPVKEHDEVGRLLRQWYAEGTAAGNWGDLYDNCDRNHSKHKHEDFPTLTRIQYDKSIKKQVPYGLQVLLEHDGVVVGNSSTAATGNPLWRSNTRRAYTSAGSMRRLYRQYTNNHLYLYPEHKDYDQKLGDVFPANSPYVLTSVGSSGTDKPFMDALFCTLAAFHPDVKQKLIDEGAISPTLQWIFRASNKNVPDDEAYLTGKAHPAVFDKKNLDKLRMIHRAHGLTADELPPLVRLKVVKEGQGQVGRDYFDVAERTKIFDTPCSIARVYRTLQPTTKIVVSAADSYDLNGKPLSYHWKVLSGDPSGVVIRPLDPESKQVEITVSYQEQHPVFEGGKRLSNRIEIGAFVNNGKYYSAPAFVTFFTLNNEERTYDATGNLEQVVYKGGTDKGPYVDPMIDAPKSWTDVYDYDDDGQVIGWTRSIDGRKDEFTFHGLLVTKKDEQGRAIEASMVKYGPVPLETAPMMRLTYEASKPIFDIEYDSPDAKRGKATARPE